MFKRKKNGEGENKRISDIWDILPFFRSVGIHNGSDEMSGEKFLIFSFLTDRFAGRNRLNLFDVGANRGNYTADLYKAFPSASIHAFEPMSATFSKLKERFKDFDNIKTNHLGLSSAAATQPIFFSEEDEHATLYANVFSDLYLENNVRQEDIILATLDSYVKENEIEKIDFLKIDTEGHELAVLKGGLNLLSEKKIEVIQFEFNEMNILSRVFLKDYYDLLKGYDFFRLNTEALIPLGNYNAINEIFQFQNIIAILKPEGSK